jgi:hypothetical protein
MCYDREVCVLGFCDRINTIPGSHEHGKVCLVTFVYENWESS